MTELKDAVFEFFLSKPKEKFSANDIILHLRQKGLRVNVAEVLDILNKSVTKENVELSVTRTTNGNSSWYAAGRKL